MARSQTAGKCSAPSERAPQPPQPPLVPVIAQDAATGTVLMLAWADRGALARTLATRDAWYWSRSRSELWRKGATSGNTQRVVGAWADCDRDAVLLQVEQTGPACHTGNATCFHTPLRPGELDKMVYGDAQTGFIADLAAVIARRDRERPRGSYVASLLSDPDGLRPLQKVGEEAAEFVIAAAASAERQRVVAEAADLLFHFLVALRSCDIALGEVVSELQSRHNPKTEAQDGLETSPPGKT